MGDKSKSKKSPLIYAFCWLAWVGVLAKICVVYFMGIRLDFHDTESFHQLGYYWIIILVEMAGSMFIRWVVIPKVRTIGPRFVLMVLGLVLLSMASVANTYVILPAHMELSIAFLLALFLCMLCYLPRFYALDADAE